MIRRVQVSVLILLCLAATSVFGATRYVTDELRISLRSGAGNQYRIVRVLDSGMSLETLETQGEWTRVRAGDETGWVRSQYLSSQRIAAHRLEEAQASLAQTRERVDELETTLAETREQLSTARDQVEELSAQNADLESQLSDAAEGLELSEENTRLRESNEEFDQRIGELERELDQASHREQREWFAVGAGVLFAGLLSGLIVTRIPWRRRSRMFE